MLWFWNSLRSEISTGKVKRDLQKETPTLILTVDLVLDNQSYVPLLSEIPDQEEATKTIYFLILFLLMQLANIPVFTNLSFISDLYFQMTFLA